MFRRRTDDHNDYDGNTTTRTARAGDGRAYSDAAPPAAAADADDGRRWHHGPTRAIVTLLAAGVAGLLAWVTTNISDTTTGGYWAVYGILAGAGVVMAISQVIGGWTKRGRPTFSPTVFVLAFIPAAIAVLWITAFHQPHVTLWRGHVTTWSHDLGIAGFVRSMGGDLLTMLAFGLGVVFGFCFDSTGALRPARPAPAPVPATARRPVPARDRTADGRAADEPIARDRATDGETVRS